MAFYPAPSSPSAASMQSHAAFHADTAPAHCKHSCDSSSGSVDYTHTAASQVTPSWRGALREPLLSDLLRICSVYIGIRHPITQISTKIYITEPKGKTGEEDKINEASDHIMTVDPLTGSTQLLHKVYGAKPEETKTGAKDWKHDNSK